MAKGTLARMNIESLMRLRTRVDERLREHRVELQKQLDRLEQATAVGGRVSGGGRGRRVGAMKHRKVPPKYRGASGETWSGRGNRPRWLVAELKKGKKIDDFLIDRSARKQRRKRKAKR